MFAQRLRELRTEKGISQKKLASEISFSQQSVAKWETDTATPSPEIISRLADIFQVSSDYLLGRTEERSSAASDVGFDDFTHAMHNESGHLSNRDKEILLTLARQMRQDQIRKEKEGG